MNNQNHFFDVNSSFLQSGLDVIGYLHAIDKTQAIIEFNTAGIILSANKNFLDLFEYDLTYLQGRHHSIFCESDYHSSAEYQDFWSDLAQGVSFSGEFKRINKTGRVVYINGTYNPIRDESGNIVKIVKFALDITERKRQNLFESAQVAAINRSLGVAEFSPDGCVLSINDELAQCLGYEKSELVGQDHRLLAGRKVVSQSAYQRFWDKLRAGKPISGEVTRLRKDGSYCYLQATYTPVIDLDGSIHKIIKYAIDITAQKELNLDMSARLAAIYRSQSVIQFGLDGVIVDANENAMAIFGYTSSELKGSHHRMLVPKEISETGEYEQFWRDLGKGKFLAGQFERINKSQQTVYLQAVYAPIFNLEGEVISVIKYAQDITEQRIRDNDFTEQLNSVNRTQSILQYDMSGQVLSVNEFMQSAQDGFWHDATGQNHSALLAKIGVQGPTFEDILGQAIDNDVCTAEYEITSPLEKKYWLRFDYSVILDVKGQPSRIMARVADLTLLKLAQQAAQEANQARGQFLANMSHEIRTPMNGVVGLVEVLQQTPLDNNQREMVEIIGESGTALLNIINDILDFSKIESGKLELEQEPFDPAKLVEKVSSLLDIQAVKRGVELVQSIDAKIPHFLVGDEVRIKQVLINLVSNAIKFSGNAADTGRVSVTATWQEMPHKRGQLTLVVQDNGIGISPQEQSRLFQAFVQANASTTRKFGGTGLGLVIVHSLVTAMQGRLELQSEKGFGAKFTAVLPLTVSTKQGKHLPYESGAFSQTTPTSAAIIAEPGSPVWAYAQHMAAGGIQVHALQPTQLAEQLRGKTWNPHHLWVLDERINPDLADALLPLIPDLPASQQYVLRMGSGQHRQAYPAVLPNGKSCVAIDVNALSRANFWRAVTMALDQTVKHKEHSPFQADDELDTVVIDDSVRIMVAEDNIANQKVIQLQLEKIGYRATIFNDGQEALDGFLNQKWDIIFTDLHMPVMDGYGFATAVREYEARRQLEPTPIIALTSNIMKEEAARCREIGMNNVVTKPTTLSALKEQIETHAHKNRSTGTTDGAQAAEDKPSPDMPATQAQDASVVDLKVLYGFLGTEDPMIANELLQAMREDTVKAYEVLSLNAPLNEFDIIRKQVHKLRSAAGYTGALRLQALCADLEQKAHTRVAISPPEVEAFQQACELVLTFIDAHVTGPADEPQQV